MKKKLLLIFTCIIFSCFIFTGCNKQETTVQQSTTKTKTQADSDEADSSEKENETEKTQKTEKDQLTVPHNKKEEEELFGTTDKNGNWVAPEESYTDKKTGNIYNKEGVLIGVDPKYFKPNPNAVG